VQDPTQYVKRSQMKPKCQPKNGPGIICISWIQDHSQNPRLDNAWCHTVHTRLCIVYSSLAKLQYSYSVVCLNTASFVHAM